MRKNLLAFLIIIIVVVLNVLLVGVLVQESVSSGNGHLGAIPLRVSVSTLSISSESDFSSLSTVSSDSSFDSNFSLGTEKLVITGVVENLSSSAFIVNVSNNNSFNIDVKSIFVNNYSAKLENNIMIPALSSVSFIFRFSEGIAFGHTYEIRILSIEGFSANYYKTIC